MKNFILFIFSFLFSFSSLADENFSFSYKYDDKPCSNVKIESYCEAIADEETSTFSQDFTDIISHATQNIRYEEYDNCLNKVLTTFSEVYDEFIDQNVDFNTINYQFKFDPRNFHKLYLEALDFLGTEDGWEEKPLFKNPHFGYDTFNGYYTHKVKRYQEDQQELEESCQLIEQLGDQKNLEFEYFNTTLRPGLYNCTDKVKYHLYFQNRTRRAYTERSVFNFFDHILPYKKIFKFNEIAIKATGLPTQRFQRLFEEDTSGWHGFEDVFHGFLYSKPLYVYDNFSLASCHNTELMKERMRSGLNSLVNHSKEFTNKIIDPIGY